MVVHASLDETFKTAEYGLDLVRRKTGHSIFEFDENAVKAPQGIIDKLVRESIAKEERSPYGALKAATAKAGRETRKDTASSLPFGEADH